MAYIIAFAALAALVFLLFRLLAAGTSSTPTVPGTDPDGAARPCDSTAQKL